MKQWINGTKKILINGGLFGVVLFFTYRFVFSKLNVTNAFALLENFKLPFLGMGILSVVAMLIFETCTIRRNLLILGQQANFRSCIKYTFAGNFFSIITPAATGGQPMQVILMSRDGIKTEKGMLALMLDLSAYQIAIVSFSLIGFFAFYKEVLVLLGTFYPMLILGIGFNILLLMVTLMAIFSDKLIYRFVILCGKILGRCHYKKTDSFEKSALQWVERYKESARILKENKRALGINFLFIFLRIGFMFTAPLWVYMGFGLSGDNLLFIIAMQAILHICCAALPFPGGVGISETIFFVCFSTIFPSALIDTAMLLSRGIGFYSIAIISGVSLLLWYSKSRIVARY